MADPVSSFGFSETSSYSWAEGQGRAAEETMRSLEIPVLSPHSPDAHAAGRPGRPSSRVGRSAPAGLRPYISPTAGLRGERVGRSENTGSGRGR
jgi:hypothetical protein